MSLLQGSIAKETYNLIDPTNQSHPITWHTCTVNCFITHAYANISVWYTNTYILNSYIIYAYGMDLYNTHMHTSTTVIFYMYEQTYLCNTHVHTSSIVTLYMHTPWIHTIHTYIHPQLLYHICMSKHVCVIHTYIHPQSLHYIRMCDRFIQYTHTYIHNCYILHVWANIFM